MKETTGVFKTYRALSAASVAFATALTVGLDGAAAGAGTVAVAVARAVARAAARGDGARGLTDLASLRAAGAGRAGLADGAARVDGGAGGGVAGQRGVDVDEDARVAGAVGAREPDGGRAGGAGAALDRDLVAAHVELGATGLSGRVQCQRLGPEQIVARRDVGRDGHVHLAAAGVQVASTPVVVVARAAAGVLGPRVREDLEPASRAVRRRGVVDLGQVHLDGTPVCPSDSFIVAAAVAGLLGRMC